VLHVVCEFNETAEPTRPSYALPATLKNEERRHGKTPFQTRPPLDQRLESRAKRLRMGQKLTWPRAKHVIFPAMREFKKRNHMD
jgi:hypothetical protein